MKFCGWSRIQEQHDPVALDKPDRGSCVTGTSSEAVGAFVTSAAAAGSLWTRHGEQNHTTHRDWQKTKAASNTEKLISHPSEYFSSCSSDHKSSTKLTNSTRGKSPWVGHRLRGQRLRIGHNDFAQSLERDAMSRRACLHVHQAGACVVGAQILHEETQKVLPFFTSSILIAEKVTRASKNAWKGGSAGRRMNRVLDSERVEGFAWSD